MIEVIKEKDVFAKTYKKLEKVNKIQNNVIVYFELFVLIFFLKGLFPEQSNKQGVNT